MMQENNNKILSFRNIVENIRDYNRLSKWKDVSELLDIDQSKFLVWRSRDTLTAQALLNIKEYCRRNKLNENYFIYGVGEPSGEEVQSNVESKSKEITMIDCGNHIISKNHQNQWERYIKSSGEIEVDLNGNWVKKSELIAPLTPRKLSNKLN